MTTRILRFLPYPAVLLVALAGVYLVTRNDSAATAAPAGHNHGAPSASSPVARAVMLSDGDVRRIGVTFAPVTLGPMSREVRVVGQITFDETRVSTIGPRVDGWVDRLYVNSTGQPVAAGQSLLTIYSPMLVTAQEELLLARRLQGEMSNAEGAASQRAADLVASARRRLSYWEISEQEIAEIERTGVVRNTLTLRAPAGGYVLEKTVLPGQKVMAGDPLFRVADLGTVWVEGEVFEQDLASVRQGQTVRAELQALPGEDRTGRIAYVYPTLNPDTRTVRIRVVLPNHDLRLKPGMYATLRITAGARDAVLSVPRSAVLSTGERSIVFIRDASGALTPREVSLGASNDDRIEILGGLRAGETVVASATFLVDAESNLGTALGGMSDKPGVELSMPAKSTDSSAADHSAMDHSAHGTPAKP